MNELQYKTIQLTVLRKLGWCFYFSFFKQERDSILWCHGTDIFTEVKSIVYFKYM